MTGHRVAQPRTGPGARSTGTYAQHRDNAHLPVVLPIPARLGKGSLTAYRADGVDYLRCDHNLATLLRFHALRGRRSSALQRYFRGAYDGGMPRLNRLLAVPPSNVRSGTVDPHSLVRHCAVVPLARLRRALPKLALPDDFTAGRVEPFSRLVLPPSRIAGVERLLQSLGAAGPPGAGPVSPLQRHRRQIRFRGDTADLYLLYHPGPVVTGWYVQVTAAAAGSVGLAPGGLLERFRGRVRTFRVGRAGPGNSREYRDFVPAADFVRLLPPEMAQHARRIIDSRLAPAIGANPMQPTTDTPRRDTGGDNGTVPAPAPPADPGTAPAPPADPDVEFLERARRALAKRRAAQTDVAALATVTAERNALRAERDALLEQLRRLRDRLLQCYDMTPGDEQSAALEVLVEQQTQD